jgi:hypothetical protein
MGYLYDHAGGYDARFIIAMAAVILVAAGMSLLLRGKVQLGPVLVPD